MAGFAIMSGTTWTKFYWSDWESDPALRLCSLAAQGLWMRMLCIASAHDPIGYVAVAGRGLDETALARMTGCSGSEAADLLGELDRNGVFSRDRTGRIFSRRMVNDAKRAAIARKNGKKGGNPTLSNNTGKEAWDNPPDNPRLKTQEPTTSNQKKEDAKASLVAGGDAAKAFDEWNALAKRLSLPMAKDLTPARRKAINARLATAGLTGWREALSAVEASPHCRGENDRGWRADIDFVATAAKFQKLREGSYGPVPSAASSSAAPPTFDGPADLRAAIVRLKDEDFARRWIDHYCRWRAEDRTILAKTEVVARTLKTQLAAYLEDRKITVDVAPANDTPALIAEGAAA